MTWTAASRSYGRCSDRCCPDYTGDRSYDWKQRGTEQAAEIVTWGIGDGEVSPLLPEAVDTPTLARLYELLTGREPITPAAR